MGEPRENTGGSKLWHEGERVSYTDLNRMGSIMQRDMLHLLAEVFRAVADGDPQSGVFGDSFLCTNPAGYDIETDLGLGLYYDSAETDDWASHYKPVALEAAETNTLDACEPVLDRYDRISLAPATDDDIPETDNIRDPATGTVTSQSKDQRRRWYGTVTVTKGTPGAGVPALPAGHLAVCTVTLPGGGAAPSVLTDDRVKIKVAKSMVNLQGCYIEVSLGAQQAGPPPYRDMTLQVKDLATGENVVSAAELLVEALNWQFEIDTTDITWGYISGGGAIFGGAGTYARGGFYTDASGAAVIRIYQQSVNLGALATLTFAGGAATSKYGPKSYTEVAFV